MATKIVDLTEQKRLNNSRKGAKAAKERIDSELGALGVPSAQLRTCLAR